MAHRCVYVTVYAEIGHMSAKLDVEIRAKTVETVSFVTVDFICLKFTVGIVEPYQAYRLGTAGLTSRSIAITAKPYLHALEVEA